MSELQQMEPKLVELVSRMRKERELAYAELVKTAIAALHALRSYQHGNSSTELAEEIADALEMALSNADIVKPAN
jgi:hypothetical protein